MRARDPGFSLLELTIAMALTLIVSAGAFGVLRPSQSAFAIEPDTADMQQRLRVAALALSSDLVMAGAGPPRGARAASLLDSFPPVLPYRQGAEGNGAGAFSADKITLVTVPTTVATTLASDLAAGDLTLQAAPRRGCADGLNLCGFTAGMAVLLYDDTGNYGTFTIAAVDDGPSQLTLASRPAESSGTVYKAGTTVAEVRVDMYDLKVDAPAQTFQLMHSDGADRADVPVVDHLVSLAFDYFGEPQPPILTGSGPTYGPRPPARGLRTTAYPAGENCTFRVDEATGAQTPRLLALSAASALVPLTASRLTDGPWCPDDTNPNRWDADLLRIRAVGVMLRVEAATAALRGPAGVLFAHGGTARGANRWLPDQEAHLRVSPRNLNWSR